MKYLLLWIIGTNAFAMTTINTSIFSSQAINNATYSQAINAQQLIQANFIAEFSSSSTVSGASGTLKIQASNDVAPQGNFPLGFTPATTSWIDIPSASASIASGSLGPIMPVMPYPLCFRWLRTVWTYVSGSGSLNLKVMAHGE